MEIKHTEWTLVEYQVCHADCSVPVVESIYTKLSTLSFIKNIYKTHLGLADLCLSAFQQHMKLEKISMITMANILSWTIQTTQANIRIATFRNEYLSRLSAMFYLIDTRRHSTELLTQIDTILYKYRLICIYGVIVLKQDNSLRLIYCLIRQKKTKHFQRSLPRLVTMAADTHVPRSRERPRDILLTSAVDK